MSGCSKYGWRVPKQVIQAATRSAAEFLQAKDLGTLETGKWVTVQLQITGTVPPKTGLAPFPSRRSVRYFKAWPRQSGEH